MTRHHPQKPEQDARIPAIARAKARVRPIVAVVGRPNVGKSTLFNRLAGSRIAIVHDEPGVTRDRNYADAFARGVEYTLIDTGGFDPESDDPMRQGIARHVKGAIAEADVVVCVLDATTDVTGADREAVQLLRASKRPVLYVANKADSPAVDALAFDHYRLGIPHIYPVSALHGRGAGELEEAIIAALPETSDIDDVFADLPEHIPRIALVGRPNAGKSSLLNRLVGEERSLVDARPGTTRDSIDALIKYPLKFGDETREQALVVIDTAGIRRKSKVEETIESVSVMRAIKAIERAEVVVLMCDADEGVAEQDAKILGLAVDRGRAVVIALNKSDLLDAAGQKKAEEAAREKLSFTPWAPVVRLSAKTGRGVSHLVDVVVKTREAWNKRVSTGALNRFFEEVLATHPPPTMNGKYVRLYYVTQAESRPPTFVVVTNEPEFVHFSYRRYIENRIREHFGFQGTPLRMRYKQKRRTARGAEKPSSRFDGESNPANAENDDDEFVPLAGGPDARSMDHDDDVAASHPVTEDERRPAPKSRTKSASTRARGSAAAKSGAREKTKSNAKSPAKSPAKSAAKSSSKSGASSTPKPIRPKRRVKAVL